MQKASELKIAQVLLRPGTNQNVANVNIFRCVFRTLSNKHLWWSVFTKKSNSQKPITSFTKKLHRRCLTGSLIHLWMKFFIKDFCNKYDQICRKLRIWSHLLKEYLIGNCMFRAESDSSHSMIIWQVIWLYLNSCLIDMNNIWCWRKVIASYTTKSSMSRVNRVINSLYGRFLCNGSAGCMSFSILQYVL